MNRAELSHPADLSPLSLVAGHREQQPSPPYGTRKHGFGPGTQVEEERGFDGVRTAGLRLHLNG